MGVDSGYGSGKARSAANSASRRNSAASAGLRKKGIKRAGRKYTSTATAKAKSVAGSSDYVARENAARTQLGTAGVAARARQLPTAARATARGLVREITGIDVSRKGVSVSPEALAMALPIGKVARAARALMAAGKVSKAAALEARLLAKRAGQETSRFGGTTINDVAMRNQSLSVFPRAPKPGPLGEPYLGDLSPLPYRTPAQVRRSNRARRAVEQGDRVYELEKRLNLPGTAPKRGR